MIIQLGVLVLLGSLSATLALPPCVCSRNLSPVCGSDGRTYNNECLLRCAQVTDQDLIMERRGRCLGSPSGGSCICTYEYNPVCGTDGRTYPNRCSLGCAQRSAPIEMAHEGDCRSKRETVQVAELPLPSCTCPRDYEPVCGTDGQTYPNECELDCDRAKKSDLRLQHKGACEQQLDCICPLLYSPVCGTDGQTYDNMCSLGCAQRSIALEVAHMGDCKTKGETVQVAELPLPSCTCPRDYEPVCGTDGQTYPNECELDCDRAKKSDLRLQHKGACEQQLDCICPLLYSPVCGTDGQTYDNMCTLSCAQRSIAVEVAHMGDCKTKGETVQVAKLPSCTCPRDYEPVCGTDGHTYSNECELDCDRADKSDLRVLHKGACEQDTGCICPLLYSPVCGTDGQTYDNMCSLGCAQRSIAVEVAHMGDCKTKRETVQVADLPLPSCTCPRDYEPVCGSDGLTYPNECELDCDRVKKPDLQVQHKGPCEHDLDCICPLLDSPVCGSDDNTYANPCVLRCVSRHNPDLKLSHMGECKEKVKVANPFPAACVCTREMKPVCGTDGNTYSNPCLLRCARERDESLRVDHMGPCSYKLQIVEQADNSCTCARNLQPVCASDGVTYSNTCLMRCAGPHLTVVKNEPCEEE